MLSKRDASASKPYSVVFDIGATSVGVGLSQCHAQGNTLLWYARLEYSYQAYDDYHRYVRSMYSTLLELGMKLTSEGLPFARAHNASFKASDLSVHCVISPPWFFAGVAESTRSVERAFMADETVLAELHTEGLTDIVERPACRSWQEVVGEFKQIDVLDQATYLQGYPIKNWRQKMVNEMSVITYHAIVGIETLDQIHEILDRVLPHSTAHVHTSTRLLAKLFHQTLWQGETAQAILIEVLGQITSISTVRRGSLVHVRTIPTGTNSILRAAAPNAISMREAQSTFEVFRKTKSGGETDELELPAVVREALEAWYVAVRDEIVDQSDGVTPPELTMVLVGNNWNEFLLPLLQRPFLVPGIREERPLVVRPCKDFVLPVHEGTDVPKDAIQDSRIQVFTHALRPRLGA